MGAGEVSIADPNALRDLHYWVWCPDVSEAHAIPSADVCVAKTPLLSQDSRPSASQSQIT